MSFYVNPHELVLFLERKWQVSLSTLLDGSPITGERKMEMLVPDTVPCRFRQSFTTARKIM